MAYYVTESFHVNVGSGDGAIHLLTSNRPDPVNNPNNLRTVERAILVDGGREPAADTIDIVVQLIENSYFCKDVDPVYNNRYLVFDAIVITHWDGDHWEGVARYISSEIQFIALDPNRNINHLEQVYCRRARYEAPDPNTHFHGAPQTFIYMPWMPYATTGFLLGGNDANGNPMMNFKISEQGNPDNYFVFTRQFKLRQGRDWLLGRNLFLHDGDDHRLSNRGNRNNFFSLQTMLDNYPIVSPFANLQYDCWPAMYCVAAEQRIPRSDVQIQTTPQNKSSIAFIIVWSEPGFGGQLRQHRVSHYFAGDAHSSLETALAGWMGPYQPKSMKLSHHGSSSSNPPANFPGWNPANITVSAGAQYGHPRWEVIFCIDAWHQLQQHQQLNEFIRKPFFPCQWPAYLRQDGDLKFKLQTFSVTDILNPATQLSLWLRARFREIRDIRYSHNIMTAPKDTYILWHSWWELFKMIHQRDPYPLEIRDWISGHVERIMRCICPMRAEGPTALTAHWIAGANQLDPNSHWNRAMADIYAIDIISAPSTLTYNGEVRVVGENILAQWVLDQFKIKMTRPTEFPVDCSRAYVLANLNVDDPKDQVTIDQYPYLGDDHPASIDISRQNPKWPTGQELGHVQSHREAWGTSAGPRDSWIDVDFEDYVLMEEEKTFSDIVGLGKASQATPPAILYRRVPNHIAQAAVYIACAEKKTDEPPRYFPADSQVVILDEKNFIFGFTDTLHFRKFSLKTVPDGLNPTPVFEDDELFKWLGQFCAESPAKEPAPGFALNLCNMAWPIVDKMSRFDFLLTIPFPDGYNLRLSTNVGAEQTFAKSTTSTSGDDAAVSFKALTNMLISRRTLVFGLENSNSPLTTTFGTAAKFFGVDLNRYPLLKMLTGNFSLVVDASKDYHNAIWFRPGMQYETHLRLQFHVDDSFKSTFNGWLQKFSKDLAVDSLLVIMRKKAKWGWGVPSDRMDCHGSATFLCSFVLSPTVQLQGVFELTDTQIFLTLTLQRPKSKAHLRTIQGQDGAMDIIIKWISSRFNVTNTDSLTNLLKQATAKDSATISDESILPRRVELVLDLQPDGSIKGISTGSIDIEACITVGRSAVAVMEQVPALFLFSFGWSKGSGFYFKGKLWPVLPETPFSQYDRALPEAEEYQLLSPATMVNPEKQLRALDLATLLSTDPGKQVQIPAGLPNEIYACEINFSQKEVSFRGAMRCKPSSSEDTKTPPILSFENVELVASYAWGTKDPATKQFKLRLMIAINLYLGGKLDPDKPREEEDANSAKLSGQLTYDQGTWSIEAKVIDLSISHLLEFWDVQDRGCILEFLGRININFVSIRYGFTKGAKNPSKLTFRGEFGIANVATFSLNYTNQGGNNWSFTASLAADNKAGETATIGHLLLGFIDKDIVDVLPDAISGAEIKGANGEEALRLLCCRQNDVSILAILVQVQSIQLWFVQLKTKDGKTKRLLKAAISKISANVSIINTTINSPWEKLFFMWVQDTATGKAQQGGKKAMQGMTQAEYDGMKTCLQANFNISDEDLMLFKQQEGQPTSSTGVLCVDDKKQEDKAKEIVINAGMHLIVVARRADSKLDVILDYLFNSSGSGTPASSKSPSNHLIAYDKTQNPPPDAAGSQKGTKAPFKVKLGPLSVSNIGLWYKKGMIGITLDATLLLGPVGLALLGFTIGMPFNDKYSLKNPPPVDTMTWGLQGLIVSLNRPPLTIAGGFMRDTSNPKIKVMYSGGLVVGFKPWLFEAMGAYANVTKGLKFNATTIDTDPMSIVHASSATKVNASGADDTFTFAFIYVRLNGPLFSVGFADFAGLVGGFGVNSDIVLPTVDQVFEFPFVKERTDDGDPSSGPIEKMQSLMQGSWFRPAEGSYWGAAGVRVTAFQMLAANIVLVIQFGNGNVVIGLFGVATCDVPALASPVKFAHAELGIICTFDVNSGVFKLEAQLSPRSFVLAPQCHLTGGLALFAWFKTDLAANVQAGSWVLTIGGYHKAFHPPRQYPVPPRLGISWSLDKNLSVVGEAYFAITPKVCMGGGRLHAALSLGALYAWFDAHVDFLMNFDPFYFQLEAGLAVGVRFTLDLWLVTIRINAEVGASLDLRGPPFGGVVHVYFWVFGFDVKFGSPPGPPPPVSLARFWQVVLKSGGSSSSNTNLLLDDPKKNADNAAIVLTCENGLLPPIQKRGQQQKENETWLVKSGKFNLMATFQFAVTQGDLTERRKILVPDAAGRLIIEKEEEETRSAHAPIQSVHQEVFSKPMQLDRALTSIVTIDVMAPSPKMASQQFFHVLETWKDQKWELVPIIKPAQTSLWGKYSRNLDPSLVKTPTDELLDGKDATMPLVMGLSLQPPEPASAGDIVNKFNITSDHIESVYLPQDTERWPLFVDVLNDQDPVWQPRGSSKKTPWKTFRDKWRDIGNKKPNEAVEVWAKRLRFDKESFEEDHKGEKDVPKFNPLRGDAPKALLDRYETMVPALPLVAVGI
ncbi:MAG: hypothetical protein Q9195_004531 [Heterodermia aff. obscurata]